MSQREREDPIPPQPTGESGEDADGAALLVRGVVHRAAETAADLLSDAVEAGGRLVKRGHEGSRRATRRGRKTLPNLFELHPGARIASRRQLGLRTIPVAGIVGTAVEGGAQRGTDFLPLPEMRSRNWRGRYQRVRAALEHLAILPPIDVLQTAQGYWVIDGHNRVAAGLAGGQDEIDALVTHVRLPGETEPEAAPGSLAAMLADGDELRAAGAGLLTPGSSLASRLGDPGMQRRYRHPTVEPVEPVAPPAPVPVADPSAPAADQQRQANDSEEDAGSREPDQRGR